MFFWTLRASIILYSTSEAARLRSNQSEPVLELYSTPGSIHYVNTTRNSSDDDVPTDSVPTLENGNADNLTLAEEVQLIDNKMEKQNSADSGTYERMGSFLTMSNFLRCLTEASESNSTQTLFECTRMFAIRPQERLQDARDQLRSALN
uniref:Uncharacterized protein n=1 Tax=Plectus sambesii TaxID=2011161 RepID=A0A914UIF4_9BILA